MLQVISILLENKPGALMRVGGLLTQVAFKEGDDVKAGQLLFQIDPRPYRATLDQADFSNADLTGATFGHTNFRDVGLAGCCFRAANLFSCDLEDIILHEADFTAAALTKSYLTNSRLRSASSR